MDEDEQRQCFEECDRRADYIIELAHAAFGASAVWVLTAAFSKTAQRAYASKVGLGGDYPREFNDVYGTLLEPIRFNARHAAISAWRTGYPKEDDDGWLASEALSRGERMPCEPWAGVPEGRIDLNLTEDDVQAIAEAVSRRAEEVAEVLAERFGFEAFLSLMAAVSFGMGKYMDGSRQPGVKNSGCNMAIARVIASEAGRLAFSGFAAARVIGPCGSEEEFLEKLSHIQAVNGLMSGLQDPELGGSSAQ